MCGDNTGDGGRSARREMLLGYINRAPQVAQRAPRLGFNGRLAELRSTRAPRGTSSTALLNNRWAELAKEREALAAERVATNRRKPAHTEVFGGEGDGSMEGSMGVNDGFDASGDPGFGTGDSGATGGFDGGVC